MQVASMLSTSLMTLFIQQSTGTVKIACVGDSITAGYLSSGGNHTYPGQLQILLDQEHGEGAFSVTNLGAGGATLLKHGDSPYWERPQYNALINDRWDIAIIMLGTNDAKSTNWPSQNLAEFQEGNMAATSGTTSLVLQGNDDFVLAGGAGLATAPSHAGALRSGSPGQNTVAASHMLMTPGSRVESIAFTYRYISGYTPPEGQGIGANFSLQIGNTLVYESPHFTDYSFDQNQTNYSMPTAVSVSNLSISVPVEGHHRLEFHFANNDRNVQLLLPISVELTCSGAEVCTVADPTPLPCGGPDAPTLTACQFADDYQALIDKVRTLGTASDGPAIYIVTPVPLMAPEYGMDLNVINSLYPQLVPMIGQVSGVLGPIDAFVGMGGVPNWKVKYPTGGCALTTTEPNSCRWFCDGQSCDQCHPNDNGYSHLAQIVYTGLGLAGPLNV